MMACRSHSRENLRDKDSSKTKLYCFDFDDTVCQTDSRVWTEDGPKTTAELASLSTLGGEEVRLADRAFREFAADYIDSCQIIPGPFLDTLGRAIDEGSPIAIVSARSMKEDDFRRLVGRAVQELLGRELHEHVHLYCCNREDWTLPGKEAPARKCAAVAHFLLQYPQAASIGFSDDDPKNLAAMRGLFAGLKVVCPDLHCRVYDALQAASSSSDSSLSPEGNQVPLPSFKLKRH